MWNVHSSTGFFITGRDPGQVTASNTTCPHRRPAVPILWSRAFSIDHRRADTRNRTRRPGPSYQKFNAVRNRRVSSEKDKEKG